MPKGHEVDKDDKVWLNTELCKTCIVEGDFKAPATKQAVADAMSAVRAKKATVFIADALFGAGSHTWDSKDAAWGTDDFNDVFAFARQDTPPQLRFSTSIMLGHFKDSAKLKDGNRQTVNKYQKPIALFAKHLKMAATDGTTIVDVAAGTGTTAVAAAFSVWWDHMDHSYSFTHRNLKTILIDNQKTQIAGMKFRMTSWFKEKPYGLPKMFGLDATRYKKGFFPYTFNTEANKGYVGLIPAIEYFSPGMMKDKKREEYFKWKYVSANLKTKVDASGAPKGDIEEFIDGHEMRFGFQLEHEKLEANPGMRALAKTSLS
eukprot:jgi/Tetstr1/462078/TSEL_007148.t1